MPSFAVVATILFSDAFSLARFVWVTTLRAVSASETFSFAACMAFASVAANCATRSSAVLVWSHAAAFAMAGSSFLHSAVSATSSAFS